MQLTPSCNTENQFTWDQAIKSRQTDSHAATASFNSSIRGSIYSSAVFQQSAPFLIIFFFKKQLSKGHTLSHARTHKALLWFFTSSFSPLANGGNLAATSRIVIPIEHTSQKGSSPEVGGSVSARSWTDSAPEMWEWFVAKSEANVWEFRWFLLYSAEHMHRKAPGKLKVIFDNWRLTYGVPDHNISNIRKVLPSGTHRYFFFLEFWIITQS